MSYLTNEEINIIKDNVKLVSFLELDNPLQFLFDSGVTEYNDFLQVADDFDAWNVSKTHLLIHNGTKELLGYLTLSADSIKLTQDEKNECDLCNVPFASIPALKIGKLAVNKKLSDDVLRKGYGSFLIEIARAFAINLNNIGVACKFLTVDADIEYNDKTPEFYKKNGFVENLSNKSRNAKFTISMRLDIFNDELE